MQNGGPTPPETAEKAVILHTFGFQVFVERSSGAAVAPLQPRSLETGGSMFFIPDAVPRLSGRQISSSSSGTCGSSLDISWNLGIKGGA